mmetsp:Transcript_20868/g.42951  ORF Transcript_20868/g.42951 Transcript_20868/m.42951 type:complete len:151 (+) Transcript_20868:2425-2877(+)
MLHHELKTIGLHFAKSWSSKLARKSCTYAGAKHFTSGRSRISTSRRDYSSERRKRCNRSIVEQANRARSLNMMDALQHKHMMISDHLERGAEVQPCSLRGAKLLVDCSRRSGNSPRRSISNDAPLLLSARKTMNDVQLDGKQDNKTVSSF